MVNPLCWMSPLSSIPFHQIVLPQTHNSASSLCRIPILRNYVRCQHLSIYDQLCLGVRALDIRICIYKGEYWCSHTFLSMPLSEVIDQVNAFLDEQKSEIVFFQYLSECSPKAWTKPQRIENESQKSELEFYLKTEFGKRLVQEVDFSLGPTIGEILANGQLVLIDQNEVVSVNRCYLDSSYFHARSDDVITHHNLTQTYIENEAMEITPSHLLMVTQEITLDKSRKNHTIWKEIKNRLRGIRTYGDQSNALLVEWLKQAEKQKIRDRVWTFSIDFASEEVVNEIISLNLQQQQY